MGDRRVGAPLPGSGDGGVERIVHISVTRPSLSSPYAYFRAKAAVDELVLGGPVSAMSVRPSLVVGGRQEILVNNIAWFLRRSPAFAVPRRPCRVQPVHVDDVARIAADAGKPREPGVVDAVGPETFTYRELVQEIGTAVGVAGPDRGASRAGRRGPRPWCRRPAARHRRDGGGAGSAHREPAHVRRPAAGPNALLGLGRRPGGVAGAGVPLRARACTGAPGDAGILPGMDYTIPAGAKIGHVHLKVSDLDRPMASTATSSASISRLRLVGGVPLGRRLPPPHRLEHLGEPRPADPPPPGTTGLFHLAILYPTRRRPRRPRSSGSRARLCRSTARPTTASHEAHLPARSRLERPRALPDRDEAEWPRDPDGRVAMVTDPLDMAGLLAEARSGTDGEVEDVRPVVVAGRVEALPLLVEAGRVERRRRGCPARPRAGRPGSSRRERGSPIRRGSSDRLRRPAGRPPDATTPAGRPPP